MGAEQVIPGEPQAASIGYTALKNYGKIQLSASRVIA